MGSKMSANKDVRQVIKEAKKAGWRVEKNGVNHIQLYPPNIIDGFVTMSSSPSSPRNFKNIKMILRSKGLNV
jgi:hypothetical protein